MQCTLCIYVHMFKNVFIIAELCILCTRGSTSVCCQWNVNLYNNAEWLWKVDDIHRLSSNKHWEITGGAKVLRLLYTIDPPVVISQDLSFYHCTSQQHFNFLVNCIHTVYKHCFKQCGLYNLHIIMPPLSMWLGPTRSNLI